MTNSKTHFDVTIFTSANAVSEEIWFFLSTTKSLYFSKAYLLSLEENHPNINFLYVVCLDKKKKLMGFLSVQQFNFSFDKLENDWQNTLKKLSAIARKLRIIPKEKPLKIMNCGLPFVSGNHGLFLNDMADKKKVLKKMILNIQQYNQECFSKNPIDILIVKDFTKDSLSTTNELISLGYYAFNVEPTMVFKSKPSWTSFEDYLHDLKTKFRVKAKKALQLSKELDVIDLDLDSIKKELPEITRLYKKVTSKAGFNLIDFNPKSYVDLLSKLDKNYFVKIYRFNGKLVGFLSGILHNNKIDAHFVGIDYALNKQLAIYQRMLYDYISLAIENKIEIINFGRTASDIKSSVGATPEHLTVYIRHRKSIRNKFLQLFLHRIQPSEFNQKFPFKNLTH